MAQNITLLGASFSDVPAVVLPKTGGGTAQFDDTTDANAAAADIAEGKTAYVNGTKVTGTNEGATLGTKSITQNGTYTAADEQLDGYSEVTVNVSGGGGQEVPEKDVNFIDYDGTVLYSYTAQEALALAALPANPSHEGLTAQGWNYTLAEMKTECNAVGGATVGQMYVTDDGKTRIYISIPDDAPSNALKFTIRFKSSVANNCVIDWGDESPTETAGQTSYASYSHTYAATGDYVITLNVTSGTISFDGNNTTSIFNSVNNTYYKTRISAVEIGNGITEIGEYMFTQCIRLETITLPNTVTAIKQYAFNACNKLKAAVIPTGVSAITLYALTGALLKRISIPQSVTTLQGIQGSGIKRVNIPSGVVTIGNNAFRSTTSLQRLTVPSNVTSIGTYAFDSSGATEYHILPATPPTLANNSFSGSLYNDTVIYVPESSLATYKAATNWTTVASKMIGE